MEKHEFYAKYANTKLDDRFNVLDFNELGMMTLNDVFNEMQKIDEIIRPQIIKQEKLLKEVEKFLN